MKALGVNLAGATAWLALVDQDSTVADLPDRYELPSRPRPEALLTAVEQIQMLYHQHEITAVAVLDAHGSAKPRSYQQARPRFTLEVLFELAAAAAADPVSFEHVAPATVASRLDLPSKRIRDHVDEVASPAGTRWNERGPAALAAITTIAGAR